MFGGPQEGLRLSIKEILYNIIIKPSLVAALTQDDVITSPLLPLHLTVHGGAAIQSM